MRAGKVAPKVEIWEALSGRNCVKLFGWPLETDVEPRHTSSDATVLIELKLVKRNQEFTALHAMRQAISYSTKWNQGLALIVHEGRGTKERTVEERRL